MKVDSLTIARIRREAERRFVAVDDVTLLCILDDLEAATDRESQLAVALRDAAVHRECYGLDPRSPCSAGLSGETVHGCNRARRLINVPAGALARLEVNND